MGNSEVDTADFWYLVRTCASLMDRRGELIFREGLGIPLAQFMVLSVVEAHPGRFNQQAVADMLALSKGTISRQVEIASKAGLLTAEVSASSRREKIITLTDSGRELVRRGDELLAGFPSTIFSDLDTEDLAATLRTLTRFVGAMGATSRAPSAHGFGQ